MDKNNLITILNLLNQIGGPVKISYQTKQINSISEDLVKFHIKKVNKLLVENISFSDEYNISDIYSLYGCLNYIINDLGEDEFETIIGENLYLVGYKILQNLKNYLT